MKLFKRLRSIHPMYYASFFLPIVIMIIMYAFKGIYPFGDRTYLRSDMYHQYCPFFSELWTKIKTGGSLEYTWNIGLGTNFTALYGYYLSSPLNWFIGFFPHNCIIELMNIIIIIKLALSSVTFNYYLDKRFKMKKLTMSLFSLFYALSGFTTAFSWNLMWLDCVYLLPLILLGLERLVNEDKGLLYTITLGMAILSNYYIAIMICIGLVFYFLVLLVTMEAPEKKVTYLQKIGYFSIFSLLAGGLAAGILLPEVYALGLTASSSFSFPKTLTQYFSMVTVLNRQLANTPVCIGLEHLPNIYCGVAVFFLFPLYIFNKKISAKEKAAKCVLLFIFIFAFSYNIPNFIWHGLHYPNSLPARQSFIYVFILLTMCFDAFKDIEEYTNSQLTKSFGLFLLYMIWLDNQGDETFDFKVIFVNVLFVCLYMLIAYMHRSNKFHRFAIIFALFCIASVECTMNICMTGYGTTGRSAYFKDYESINKLTTNIMSEDTSFYRIAKAFGYRSKNDAAWHNFPNASTFSSTSYAGVNTLLGNLGLEHSMNAYADHGATALVYSMLDIKYILSNKKLNNPTLEYVDVDNNEYLYKCKYTLPLGYMVSSSINEEWTYTISNPFSVQNSWAVVNTGVKQIFTPIEKTDNGKSGITITVNEDQLVYVYVGNKSVKNAKVTINEKNETFAGINHGRIIDLGLQTAGTEITIVDKDGENSLNASVYTMNVDKFIQYYEIMSEQTLNVTKQEDTLVKGDITVTDSGILMLTIPYDPSWTLKVDGVKTEYIEVAGAFIGVELSSGHHDIELSYTPRGLKLGLLVSLLSALLVFVIYCFYRTAAGKSFFPWGKKTAAKKIATKTDAKTEDKTESKNETVPDEDVASENDADSKKNNTEE